MDITKKTATGEEALDLKNILLPVLRKTPSYDKMIT